MKFLKNWRTGENTTYDIVKNASLREHSFNVVRELVELIKKEYGKGWRIYLPKAIITGLLHDIGKLPSYREKGQAYRKLSHQKSSQMAAIKLMQKHGFKEDYIEEVASAVGNHHSLKVEGFTKLLKEADKKAREKELLKYGENVSDTRKHFKLVGGKRLEKEFLAYMIEKLYPYINTKHRFKGKTMVHVFENEGYIYFEMELLMWLITEDKSVVLPDIFYMEEDDARAEAKKIIANTLRYYNYLKPDIKEPFFSTNYSIVLAGGKVIENQRKTAVSVKMLELIGKSENDLPSLPSEMKILDVKLYVE